MPGRILKITAMKWHFCHRLDIVQAAFADDLTVRGKLKSLHNYWQRFIKLGPKTGYFPKPPISWLITKPDKYLLIPQLEIT